MITETLRRYSRAKERVEQEHINPIAELLEAAKALVVEARADLDESQKAYHEMRPVWVNENNETTTIALAQLWSLLGVDNQTDAVIKLEELLS